MKGVLLVNLGSPDSTDPKDVKKYLGEFLMDERVIDVPIWARTLLVKGIVLNTRPKKICKGLCENLVGGRISAYCAF
jgi:ferrochelatase